MRYTVKQTHKYIFGIELDNGLHIYRLDTSTFTDDFCDVVLFKMRALADLYAEYSSRNSVGKQATYTAWISLLNLANTEGIDVPATSMIRQ